MYASLGQSVTLTVLPGSESMSLFNRRMSSSGDPVTQPSEQKRELTEGPNASLQPWLRIRSRPQVIVPGMGTGTLPFGFEVGSVVQLPVASGDRSAIVQRVAIWIFLHCTPSPSFARSQAMITSSCPGCCRKHHSVPLETTRTHLARLKRLDTWSQDWIAAQKGKGRASDQLGPNRLHVPPLVERLPSFD